VTLQLTLEIVLAATALALLTRGVHRVWLDQLRRPVTLLVWAFLTAILLGAIGGGQHPDPWWFVLPAAVLVWEAQRGWRQAPRCHLWEVGIGALSAALALYILSLGAAPAWLAPTALSLAVGLALIGAGLLFRSRRREPTISRSDDWAHYERREERRRGPL
jgi:hypothetical protein